MTTEKAESKLYESLPQPNEDKPITVDTFSPWVIPVARIKRFNGVKNSPEIMAVYSHLLGWKKTTGEIRPSQQYIADCCCMGLSTVQKKVKVLVKMGWITATPARKPGSKEISHTDYTVKDPEEILAEQNAGLSQQGDAVATIAKNQKVKTGESGKDEQKQEDDEQPVTTTSAAAAGVGEPLPAVDASDDADLSGGDDAVNQITIFDEDGVVTEEFINSLSGDAAPNRNADGTLQSIKYVYWVARHSQDERDGIPVRTREVYMAEARPEHIPFHLLPDDVPAPITEPAPAMQQVNGPDVDHINCEDSEETQEEVFEPPF